MGLLILAAFFAPFGLLGLYAGIRGLRRQNRSRSWATAQGVVAGFDEGFLPGARYGRHYCYPVVDFMGPAGPVRFTSQIDGNDVLATRYAVGEQIGVLFNPADPNEAEIDSSDFRSRSRPLLALAAGLGCSCASALLVAIVVFSALAASLGLGR